MMICDWLRPACTAGAAEAAFDDYGWLGGTFSYFDAPSPAA